MESAPSLLNNSLSTTEGQKWSNSTAMIYLSWVNKYNGTLAGWTPIGHQVMLYVKLLPNTTIITSRRDDPLARVASSLRSERQAYTGGKLDSDPSPDILSPAWVGRKGVCELSNEYPRCITKLSLWPSNPWVEHEYLRVSKVWKWSHTSSDIYLRHYEFDEWHLSSKSHF